MKAFVTFVAIITALLSIVILKPIADPLLLVFLPTVILTIALLIIVWFDEK